MTENVVIADSSKAILKPIYLEINGFFKCAFYDKINLIDTMYSYMNIYIFNQFFHLFSIRFLPAKIYIALEFFLPFQFPDNYFNIC